MDGFGYSFAGVVVGLAVGATGVGGGSLMTPILILFYGIPPAVAVGTDLLYASLSKSWGVALHTRNRSVDWKIVGLMATGSVPASLLTLLYIRSFGSSPELDQLIKLVLAVAVIVTAVFTIFQDQILGKLRQHARGLAQAVARHQKLVTVLGGAAIGSVVTISSVGAGVIGMMMLLVLYRSHPPIKLVGADLAHAVLITAIAGLGHAGLGTVNYSMLGWLLLGALPGIYLGTRIGFKLDALRLKRLIAVMLILAGSMTLYKALAG